MKHRNLFITALLVLLIPLATQAKKYKPLQKAKKTITLKISQDNGTNGSAVAYNPHAKLYYALIAGNGDYPLETFSSTGKLLAESNADSDMRGLWWNPNLDKLEGNCYGSGGIVQQKLNNLSYATLGTEMIHGGQNQPSDNAIGVFNAKKNEILYFDKDNSKVVVYDRESAERKDKDIVLSLSSNMELNASSMIYTGLKKMEIGLLDYDKKLVYLFNQKNGELRYTVNLPMEAYCSSYFKFAYANKQLWLYDEQSRAWTGYQIFK